MSVEWGTLSERASWPASRESPLQTLWRSLGRQSQPAVESAAKIAQLAALPESAAEQLEARSTALLVPSSAAGDLITPGPEPLQAVLASPQCRLTDELSKHQASYKAASYKSVCSSESTPAWECVAAADPDGLAIIGAPSAETEVERLRLNWSQAADAGSSGGSSSTGSSSESILSRSEPAATDLAQAAGWEQAGQQSALRVSKAARPGFTDSEGNILGFGHGGAGCERRPGGLQSFTASARISQWLEKGHEVSSVRL